MKISRHLNGACNVLMLVGLLVVTAAIVWGLFASNLMAWQITICIGGIILFWSCLISVIARQAEKQGF